LSETDVEVTTVKPKAPPVPLTLAAAGGVKSGWSAAARFFHAGKR